MRLGVISALQRLGGARRVSGLSLAALMCASAFAPVIAAGVAISPTMLASLGVIGAVGAGTLTDVVDNVIDHLRESGKELTSVSVEEALAIRIEEALQSQEDSAAALREAVAALLQEVGAVAALLTAAADRDRDLLRIVGEGFTELGGQFGEFAFALNDVRQVLWSIEGELRQAQVSMRVDQERARETSLMLWRLWEDIRRQSAAEADGAGEPDSADTIWQDCPYRGLFPFEEWHSQIFYGRHHLAEQLVQQVSERLLSPEMLLVTGVSGAGKSSLLKAGMMPRLAAGALGPGSDVWPRRVIRPTVSPLRELTGHLAEIAGLDPVLEYQSLSQAPELAPLLIERALISFSPKTSWRMPDGAVADVPPRLLLVVDQFEELFTAGEDTEPAREEREAFVTALQAAATVPIGRTGQPGALVVIAVRGDFLGRVIDIPALATALDAGPFVVGPMTEAELRLAITGPAAEAGLALEPALVETLLADTLGRDLDGSLDGGVLPLVSQAMAATWSNAKERPQLVGTPARRGGIADLVNHSAQVAYDSLTSSQRDAARLVFTQLTIVTADGQLVRRRSEEAICIRLPHRKPPISRRRLTPSALGGFSFSDRIAWRFLMMSCCMHGRSFGTGLEMINLTALFTVGLLLTRMYGTPTSEDLRYLYPPGRLAELDAAAARWERTPVRYPPALPDQCCEFLQAGHRAARRAARLRRTVIAGLLTLIYCPHRRRNSSPNAAIASQQAANANRQHLIALSRQLDIEALSIDATDP